jgi:CRISPR-associated protein Cas5d
MERREQMGIGVSIRTWGELALFSRPEMKVERCSYDVITPSAARGVLEAIYWHPGIRWVIDKIYVLKPIQFTSIRRNEVKGKLSARNALSAMNGSKTQLYVSSRENIVQRASILLSDVEYVIDAHFELTDKANESDNSGKFKDIIMRRLRKGQCYHTPYFGCREFPARFELFEGDGVETAYQDTEKDLGYMLYDLDYSDPENIQPMFFRAVLKNGVLDLSNCEVIR